MSGEVQDAAVDSQGNNAGFTRVEALFLWKEDVLDKRFGKYTVELLVQIHRDEASDPTVRGCSDRKQTAGKAVGCKSRENGMRFMESKDIFHRGTSTLENTLRFWSLSVFLMLCDIISEEE